MPSVRDKVRADLGDPLDHDPIPRPSWETRYRNATLAVDTLVALVASEVALLSRSSLTSEDLGTELGRVPYAIVTLVVAATWLLLLAAAGAYDRRRLGQGLDEYRRVLNAGVNLLAAIAIATFALRLSPSRGFVLAIIPALVLATIGGRYGCRRYVHHQRARGRSMHRVVAVGSVEAVRDLVEHLHKSTWAGFQIVAATTASSETSIDVGGEVVPVFGDVSSTIECLESVGADMVAIADPTILPDKFLRDLSWALTGRGVDLVVAPAMADVAGPRVATFPAAGLPLVHIQEAQLSGWSRLFKSLFDRSVATVALIALSPMLLVTAVAIKLTDRGPVLFRQTRVGRHGELFQMIKFRSMVPDAERLLDDLRDQSDHDDDHVLFKMADDPRVTRVGRVLRRFSLDELPQLWHVVRGDMSLVGPRPPLPSEVMAYDEIVTRRLLVKPGMTGLWQVSGRADLDWQESVRIDLHYVDHWSIGFDLTIIAKTIAAVLQGRGAY